MQHPGDDESDGDGDGEDDDDFVLAFGEDDVPDIGAVVSAEWRGGRSRSRKQTVKTYAHGQKDWTQYWNARDMSASVTQNKTAEYIRWMTTRPLKRGDVPGARLRFRAISGALSAIACFPYFLFLLLPFFFACLFVLARVAC